MVGGARTRRHHHHIVLRAGSTAAGSPEWQGVVCCQRVDCSKHEKCEHLWAGCPSRELCCLIPSGAGEGISARVHVSNSQEDRASKSRVLLFLIVCVLLCFIKRIMGSHGTGA